MAQEAENTPQETPEVTPAPESTTETPKTEAEVFDKAYVAELRREAAKYRTEAQEAKGKLTEREEAEQSDLEKAQSKLAKAEQKAAENETALLRFQVANEKKVPADAVDLLQGTSREDLEASADKILSLVTPKEEPKPDFDGGAREPADSPESPETAHNNTVLEALGLLNK